MDALSADLALQAILGKCGIFQFFCQIFPDGVVFAKLVAGRFLIFLLRSRIFGVAGLLYLN